MGPQHRPVVDEADLLRIPRQEGMGCMQQQQQQQPPPQPEIKRECPDWSIQELLEKECLLDIAKSYCIDQIGGSEELVADQLCKIGDDIVLKLVQWVRQLPFYREIPADAQSQILANKWHELLLIIMTAYGALHAPQDALHLSYQELYHRNMVRMMQYLNSTFHKAFTLQQLNADIGDMMEKVTRIMAAFRETQLSREEYVCLQVILLLSAGEQSVHPGLQQVREHYMLVLQQFVESRFPGHPARLAQLLALLPQIQAASSMLLKSKMIYIPFLLNS